MGIEANDVTFSSPKGFDKPLTHIDSMKFKLNFFPLFEKKIEVDTLVLKGADIYLAQRANGKNNWTFSTLQHSKPDSAIPTTSTKTNAQATADTTNANTTNNSQDKKTKHVQAETVQNTHNKDTTLDLPLFNAKNIQVQESRLSFIAPNADYRLEHINLKLNNVTLKQAFPLALSFKLITPKYTLNQTLNSKILVKLPQGQVNQAELILSALNADSHLKRPKLPDISFTLQGQAELNLAKDQLSVGLKQAKLANANLTGALTVQQLNALLQGKALSIIGSLTTNNFNLSTFLKDLGIEINPKLPLENTQAALKFKPMNNSQSIKLTGQLNDSKLNGDINLTDLATPKLTASFNLDQSNLTPYIKAYATLPQDIALHTKDINLQADFNLPKNWQQQGIIPSLQGTLRANIQHTQLIGFDLVQMVGGAGDAFNRVDSKSALQHAFSKIKDTAKASEGASKQTNLSPTTLNMTIKQGRAQFNYKSRALPDNLLTGQGTLNLNQPQDYFTRVLLYRYNPKQGENSVIGVRFPIFRARHSNARSKRQRL
ncbi:hypothetical protein BGC07_04465 [Piscirickettsia litoralis]|uniref:AsmA domain-containing protein n=1 Tax=Piscirickettsia litoralis TaxID=1891921 RepID=A0ABX3A119_9GAMM|nr:hypothetical protein BGC07_04465 [Piscirickettsia litoralis]